MFWQLLVENRINFVKKTNSTLSTSHDRYAIHKDAGKIVDHFAEHGDPSKNKQYTQWIVGQYKKQNIRQEDAQRIKTTLANFDKYKPKLAEKDITKYKTLDDVDKAVEPHLGKAVTKTEEKQRGLEVLYKDDKYQVNRLLNKQASQMIYGGGARSGKKLGTNWCTAADSDSNWYSNYTRGDGKLYTVHVEDDERAPYQLHNTSGQFMDRFDNHVGAHNFRVKHPIAASVLANIHPWFWEPKNISRAHSMITNPETPTEIARSVYDAVNKHGSKNDLSDFIQKTITEGAPKAVLGVYGKLPLKSKTESRVRHLSQRFDDSSNPEHIKIQTKLLAHPEHGHLAIPFLKKAATPAALKALAASRHTNPNDVTASVGNPQTFPNLSRNPNLSTDNISKITQHVLNQPKKDERTISNLLGHPNTNTDDLALLTKHVFRERSPNSTITEPNMNRLLKRKDLDSRHVEDILHGTMKGIMWNYNADRVITDLVGRGGVLQPDAIERLTDTWHKSRVGYNYTYADSKASHARQKLASMLVFSSKTLTPNAVDNLLDFYSRPEEYGPHRKHYINNLFGNHAQSIKPHHIERVVDDIVSRRKPWLPVNLSMDAMHIWHHPLTTDAHRNQMWTRTHTFEGDDHMRHVFAEAKPGTITPSILDDAIDKIHSTAVLQSVAHRAELTTKQITAALQSASRLTKRKVQGMYNQEIMRLRSAVNNIQKHTNYVPEQHDAYVKKIAQALS